MAENPDVRLCLISIAAAQDCNSSPFTDYGNSWNDGCDGCDVLVGQYIEKKLDRTDNLFEYQPSCAENQRKSLMLKDFLLLDLISIIFSSLLISRG